MEMVRRRQLFRHFSVPFESAKTNIRVADGVTVDQFLAGLEYMYHVLCGRDERPAERVEFLPQYST